MIQLGISATPIDLPEKLIPAKKSAGILGSARGEICGIIDYNKLPHGIEVYGNSSVLTHLRSSWEFLQGWYET